MTDTRPISGGVKNAVGDRIAADQSTILGDGTTERPLSAGSMAITGVINVKDFGARGDGVADDAVPIQEAVAVAAEAVASGAFGAFVYFPRGEYLSSARIFLPNGTGLRGDTSSGTVLIPSSDFDDESFVCNQDQTGGQEFVFLRDLAIDGNKDGGARCSVAVVDLVSVFINSYLKDLIVRNGSSVGLRIAARNALGPVVIRNTWVQHCDSHNVLLEEEVGNTGGVFGISASGLWSENCGPDASAIYLRGRGHSSQWSLRDVHIEQGTSASGRVGITIDGVPNTLVDGVQILRGSTPLAAGILITDVEQNLGIQIRNVVNPNLVDPILRDDKNQVTIGAVNFQNYAGSGVSFRGGPRFVPGADPSAVSLAIQDAATVDRAWFDTKGRVTGSSFFGAALEILADAVNDRPLLLVSKDESLVYGFHFEDGALRLKYFTNNKEVFNIDTLGRVFVYEPMTIQFLLTLQSAIVGPGDRNTPPTGGNPGEIILNANPILGGFAAWVCISADNWEPWGKIGP